MSFGGFVADLANNPVFAGVAGGAGASALLYQARALPASLWGWVKRRLSVTLVIDNSEDLFDRLSIYLSTSPFVQRARWLRMAEMYDHVEQRWVWQATFGLGWHLFRDDGTWFLLHRALDEKNGGLTLQRRETMTLRTFGPKQGPMRRLMQKAEKVYDSAETTRIYVWHRGGYLLADYKPRRPLDTIFIPDEQKQRLVADLQRFLGQREAYRRRGTPYRRGYLFEGPPGTGKTSLAFALASKAERPIYMININTAGGDTGLLAAFNMVETGSVIVIEDIDTAAITRERTIASEGDSVVVKPEEQVTLAGLLNVIDGLASRENRILIVTSNHADTLDAALVRPGRIDVTEEIGLVGEREALAMSRAFLGTGCEEWFDQAVSGLLPIAPAELQGMLIAKMEIAADRL